MANSNFVTGENVDQKAIEERVLTIFSTVTGIHIDKVYVTHTYKDLNIDSLDEVELLEEAENQFGIDIGDDAAESVKSVQGLIDLVKSLTK